jgi:N-methylhydantoinase B/oxoprolinase/acetone carboxylase alpha subunit
MQHYLDFFQFYLIFKDIFQLETPGGGGFGLVEANNDKKEKYSASNDKSLDRGSLNFYKYIQESS